MNDKYYDEFKDLGHAIVAQSVEDYQMLQQLGIIRKGQCAKERWPKQKGKRIKYTTDYVFPFQVQKLIRWIADPNGMRHLLDSLNSPIDCDVIINKLAPWKYY